MKIANPLYDYAFKYLMSNDKLAKKVLATILEKEILELELSKQEVVYHDENKNFTLYRLDFKALIKDDTGKKEWVLIEIQKSKLPSNILRFRNYLGHNYLSKTVKKDESGYEEEKVYPIISIYILGYSVQDIPVMSTKIDRKIIDTSTHEELHISSDFIDLLTHTCYVLQVRRLPEKRQTKIEKFMTLFNQAWVESSDKKFILDLQEVPEGFEDVVAYLQNPLKDSQTIEKLKAEQEVEALFAKQESELAFFKAQAEAAQRKEEEAKAREEEAKAREEEAKVREEEAKAREKAILLQSIQALQQAGLNDAQIAATFHMSVQELDALLNSK